MSKTIKMPTDRGSRIAVEINGEKHIYAAGVEYTVSDAVSAAIADSLAMKPKPEEGSAKAADLAEVNAAIAEVAGDLADLSADVDGLDTRLDALDDASTGAVPALDGRVDALDTPETGAIALLDARVTALETAQNGSSSGGSGGAEGS